MTSKDSGTSEHALIDLIYRHLKENGYKKAASVLKKHAPQVSHVYFQRLFLLMATLNASNCIETVCRPVL